MPFIGHLHQKFKGILRATLIVVRFVKDWFFNLLS